MGIRSFIAIPLSVSLKKGIAELLDELKQMNADIKWVPAENVHITVKFLGDVAEDALPAIEEALSKVSASQRSFTVKLSGTGFFPDKRRPRVLWIDIQEYQGLRELQDLVEESLISLGLKKETKNFSPHLTIGRVRTTKNLSSLVEAMETLKGRDFGNIEVRLLSLMKSELKPTGAEYKTLAEFNLKGEE
ncbi:MAG: RNA 2',3'-cyclic phosphodiesterase [Thermodesulfovibrionales bacterium]|jgi:2'-5' RNA ligase